VAGGKMKSSPEDSPSWDGTNTSGFSGLAGGFRNNLGGFSSEGNAGYFWSASAYGLFVSLSSGSSEVSGFNNYQRYGFSVRCVRD